MPFSKIISRYGHHARPLELPFLPVGVLVNSHNPCLLRRSLTFSLIFIVLLRLCALGETSTAVHEILQLSTAQLSTLHAEHEGDGIHEGGLAGAIGSDN